MLQDVCVRKSLFAVGKQDGTEKSLVDEKCTRIPDNVCKITKMQQSGFKVQNQLPYLKLSKYQVLWYVRRHWSRSRDVKSRDVKRT